MVDSRTIEVLDTQIAQLSKELCDLLGLTELDVETLEALEFSVDNPFINGEEPMDFASFSLALDGAQLSKHQIDTFAKMGLLTARSFVSKYRKVREAWLCWGKGSCAYSELLTDIVSNTTKTFEGWCKSGEPVWVKTLNLDGSITVVETSPVFCKGMAQTYRVFLADGSNVAVSPDHEFLSSDGWIRCQDLVVGETRVVVLGTREPLPNPPPDTSYMGCIPKPSPLTEMSLVLDVQDNGVHNIYDVTVPHTHCYFDSQGILHHNSGKDWIIARYFAWVTYILHHMNHPKQYFRPKLKTTEDERIEIINIAPKGELAKEVFFEYLSRNFRRDFFKPYVTNERDQILTNRIYFPKLNLHVLSLNSSSSGLDGYNPFLWCMDEADAFLDNANRSNAALLRRILSSSAGTRWPDMWLGMVASYLRSGAGFVARTIQLFKDNPSPGIFIDQAASWDVNPNISRNSSDVKQAYFEDPVAAAAMYEGIVPPVVDPFIHRSEYIRMSVGDQKTPAIVRVHDDLNDLLYRDIHGVSKGFVWCEVEHIQKEPGRRYYMGVDAAETGDAFAISVFSVADDNLLGPHTICPRCWGRGKDFYQNTIDGYLAVSEELAASSLECAVCGHTIDSFHPRHTPNAQKIVGWHRRVAKESGTKTIEIGGESVVVPHVREDVLILLQPIKKRVHASLPDGAAVDFLSAQALITTLCRELDVDSAGFDAHQMVGTIQYVSTETRTNVQKMSFSNTEQFLRGRLARFFLYSGLITFAGEGVAPKNVVEIAIREAEQLQKIKQRLDHPPGVGSSKDTWDARAIAIYLAVTANITGGEIEWLFREKRGEDVGKPKDQT